MRRKSDLDHGERTGDGRRARDQVLVGESPRSLDMNADLQNLSLFVGDEIREAALALGGIEEYLVKVSSILRKTHLNSKDLASALDFDGTTKLSDLEESLGALHRSLSRLYSHKSKEEQGLHRPVS